MKTKIFTLLLALLTANSLWAYDFQIDDFNFRVINQENRTLEVYAKDQDIEEADIPETVTYNGTTYIVTQIRGEGFANCSNLTSITIPNSVSHIGDLAFSYCTSLKVIKLFVEGRHLIGEDNEDDSNDDDDDESGVIVPPCWWCGSAVKIAPRNFAGQEASLDIFYGSRAKVTTVILGDGVTYIPEGLCQSMFSLTSIEIPNSVTSIEKCAFYDCSSLASITLPDNLTSIGQSAFLNCTSLESITIPDSVTNIGNGAFSGCSFLKSIILPNSVTNIGEFAFAFCSSLKYITIPNSVTSIGENVCYDCKNLEEIYCYPAVPPAVGDPYFYDFNYNSVTLYVPCDSKEVYEEHPVFGKFEKIKGIDGCGEYVTTHIYDTICQGEVYEFRGCLYDSTGIYTSTVDLIPTYLYLTVLPSPTVTITVEANDSCIWHDEVYTESGEYKYVTVAANGCDSTEVLLLTIISSEENEPEQPQSDSLYYRYVTDAANTVLSETLLTQDSFDKFTTVSVKGDQQWTLSKSYGATMNGYSVNMTYPNEDWFISPALDLSGKSNAILSFDHCFGPASAIPTTDAEKAQYTIWVSNDYNGDVQSATWTQLDGMIYGTSVWKYVSSGDIAIPANYLTENCHIAWKYVCEDVSATWEIKNVLLTTPTNQVEVIAGENKYSGDITIPVTTIFNGQKCDVIAIAENAFNACSTLTSITIPNSVKYIGNRAFFGCNELEKTNFIGDIADWCDIKFDGAYANPITVSYNFYLNNQQIKDLVIPNTVDSIPAYAFVFCKSFTSITIPNSVTYIGEFAFELCSNVNSIFIPKSVKSIQQGAFAGGVNLQSIIVEEGNPVYDSRDNCNAIIETESNTLIAGCSITNIPKAVTHIGAYAFSYQYLLTSIKVPTGIISIGDHAYYSCGNATSVFIPNSVTSVGRWALFGCESLNSIVVEEGNSVYDSRNNCNALIETASNSLIVACQNTIIPNSVTNIGEEAFFNCNYTTSISLPKSVANIEPFAFYHCPELDTIYCYATVPPTTTKYAFRDFNVELYVPCESLADYKSHEVWGQFSNIDCITSNKVETDTVVIDASTTSVIITWPTEIGADSYTIIITKDGEVFCTLTFDSEGRLLNIAFSPGRNGNHPVQYAEQVANGYRFTVTGLESGTKYNYTITTKDSIDQTISTYSGEFTTQSNVSTSVSDNQYPITDTRKEYRDGQLIIIRDGVEYNAVGVRL